MAKASIIITTHSRPNLLPRAVESAQQAGADIEVIVVDDASTDETSELCKSFSGIRYVRLERNQNVAGARNVGILASTSEYISFLDDDDTRLPGSLDTQVRLLESSPEAGFVYGRILLSDQNGVLINNSAEPGPCLYGDVFWDLLEHNFIPCLTVVFRKTCLYRVGLLESALPGIDDWDLWIRIAELYPVVVVEQPVGTWRMPSPVSDQGSSRMADIVAQAARVQRQRWLMLPRAAGAPWKKRRETRRRFLKRSSDMLIWNARAALPKGYNQYARKNVLTALRLNPFRSVRLQTFQLLAASFQRQLNNTQKT